LEKLHDMAVLHRDIKCGNVLLQGDPAAGTEVFKICDFGEGKVLDDARATVDRAEADVDLSAPFASPELFDGVGIGLPADIYAFGVVMWEVMTRRTAWHWINHAPVAEAIMRFVGVDKQRPRVPQGLSGMCANKIRACFHHEPKHRPKARKLTQWLEQCRRQTLMITQSRGPVAARVLERNDSRQGVPIFQRAQPETCRHWSKGGRYSVHPSWLERGQFHLTLVADTQDKWIEPAQQDEAVDSSDEEAEDLGQALEREKTFSWTFDQNPKPKPLGIVFRDKVSDEWPKVKRLDKLVKGAQAVAANYPEIKPGCTLISVNSDPIKTAEGEVLQTFKEVVPEIKNRPLDLVFSAPEDTVSIKSDKSYVAMAAMLGGMRAVVKVHHHEVAHDDIDHDEDAHDRFVLKRSKSIEVEIEDLDKKNKRLEKENAELKMRLAQFEGEPPEPEPEPEAVPQRQGSDSIAKSTSKASSDGSLKN